MTPEELEAQLRMEAEAEIKALVEKYRQSEDKTINDIEAAALKGMVQARPSEGAIERCPQCGGRLHSKGQRGKWLQTQAGEVHMSRDYYYCEACGTGFFPQ